MKSGNMNFQLNWSVISFVFKINKLRTMVHLLNLDQVCWYLFGDKHFIKQTLEMKL
jgi:hypothetical protein